MTEYDKKNKWEYLSYIRLRFSELTLKDQDDFYKFIYTELKEITKMNVVLILSDSITYNNHIAITSENIDKISSWHDWFDKLAGKENIQNLRKLIWENQNPIKLDTKEEVKKKLFNKNTKNFPIHSWFSTPIMWDAHIVGSIIIYSKNKENTDKKLYDIKYIEHFSKHLAIVFKNKRILDRDKVLVTTARKLYFDTKKSSSFDAIVNDILAKSYGYAKELMNVNNFLAFVVPEKHILVSPEIEPYLSYKESKKTTYKRNKIFSELARYIIEHPQEKILLTNKVRVEKKLSVICPNSKIEELKLPDTLIVVPMSLGSNEARGAFILYHMDHKSAYDEDDRKVIDRLSDQAALAIDKAHSQQLRDKTHRERHKALFDMNSILFKLDSSHLSEKEAIQKVLKIAIDHIRKIIINIENVSMFTIHYQNYSDLKENLNNPELQLTCNRKCCFFDCSEKDIPVYIKEAALYVIKNPSDNLLSKNRKEFKSFGFSCNNNTPQSFLAVPMRLDEKTASGAFVFHGSADYLYDEDDLQFIDDITDSVALIIKNILVRIEKEKILFGMSRELLRFVKDIGEETNEEIIEKILTTSYAYTQKLAKADNLMIYMRAIDDKNSHNLSLQLKKSYKNKVDVSDIDTAKPIPIQLINYVANNPKSPILWGAKEEALNKLKDLDIANFGNIPESLLIVPMSLDVDNPANGVFVLYDFERKNRFENEDKDFMDELSDQIAVIIDNLLLNHTKNKLYKAMEELSYEVSLDINSSEAELLEQIHEQADEIIDVDNMYIARFDAEEKMLRFPLFYKDGKKLEKDEIVEKYDRLFSNLRTEWVINNKPLIIYTKKESIEWYEEKTVEYREKPFASWIGTPIILMNKVWGVLVAFNQEEDNIYDDTDLKIIGSLSNKLATALENSRLYKEAQEALSRLDKATKDIAQTQDLLTKSLIANDLVHRLNNLAAPIPIWVDLCYEELNSSSMSKDSVNEYLGEIVENAENILNEAKNLKEPEIESNISIKKILETLIRQTIIQYRNEVHNNDLTVQHNISENLYSIFAIPLKINHAIYCVISNGVDAILTKGKGSLSITAENISIDSNEWINIIVTDNGLGIPREIKDKIFEPYVSSKEGSGRGYGLWRTKSVIEELGGSILFNSSNEGTTFSISLPKSNVVN